jgi:hypothetical protein
MGRRPSYAADFPNKDYLCPELTYDEFNRLVDNVGLREATDLAVRISRRDSMLKDGHKSVPKHRKNPKGPRLP